MKLAAPTAEQRARVNYDAYILGPGDSLQIELLDLPELSGRFTIGPDGTIYLPRLRALYVEGLTIEELRSFLNQQFSAFVLQPDVYVRPVGYRPVRIYVRGEVRRPGYYTLSGSQQIQEELAQTSSLITNNFDTQTTLQQKESSAIRAARKSIGGNPEAIAIEFPTVFDAIRAAQGITPYSDLGKVEVTRTQPISSGGGRIRTKLNFISLITDGNESQNIRLLDGDVIKISRSDEVLREQLLEAGQTNLSPQFLEVFVSGRVKVPGGKVLPQGSTLIQAIDMAGGLKILHGSIEFIRFNREGAVDRRVFRYNRNAPSDDYKNPVLMAGDVIRARESPLSAATEVIGEITEPALGLYSIYGLLGGINQ
ncbi:polysaccharide biosynthesis/export family protein [Synechococcus sp. Minos11]|nr:polysaccharide biosynthesis/export family protein [Synechococcus sp. Minos11]